MGGPLGPDRGHRRRGRGALRRQLGRSSASGPTQAAAFWGAIAAFVADAVVTVVVSMFTQPKPIEELQGLVHGMANEAEALSEEEKAWYRKPSTLAISVLGIVLVLSIIFW